MAYLYETHLHTAEASRCANSQGADYVARYIDMGYSGIIVTDHFFNGNCAVSRSLPWNEWVNRFCRGYESAREEGEKRGLDVFFGWEETFEGGDDYLVYGLDKNWLLEHPECRTWTRGQQYKAVREAGGCVIQAHPFRQRYYISRITISTGCIDAVEAANGGNDARTEDSLAYRYAKKTGKPYIAGTDNHDASSNNEDEYFGVYFNRKIKDICDFADLVRNNKIAGIKTEKNRFDFSGKDRITAPVDIRDKDDKVTGRHWRDFI